jgi:hypothetical protein
MMHNENHASVGNDCICWGDDFIDWHHLAHWIHDWEFDGAVMAMVARFSEL